MNRNVTLAAVLAATALFAAGCDKPRTSTSYNNSGTDATPMQPASSSSTDAAGSPTVTTTVTTANTANQGESAPVAQTGTTTPDTASSNVASTSAPSDNTSPGSASGPVSETVTTGKIKAAIAADSAMKDSDISVSTKDGVVTLGGTVKSQDQVAIATNLAQRQEGVQRVESNVAVR